jgi:hypothetical protein
MPAPAPAAPATAPGFEIIPLSATLPEGFTQAGFKQDREKSIYYIEDARMDNVVLVLEESGDLPTAGLVSIALGGDTPAYGTQGDGYGLLTFIKDGVLYTMTCRHDVNTLLRLGQGLIEV